MFLHTTISSQLSMRRLTNSTLTIFLALCAFEASSQQAPQAQQLPVCTKEQLADNAPVESGKIRLNTPGAEKSKSSNSKKIKSDEKQALKARAAKLGCKLPY